VRFKSTLILMVIFLGLALYLHFVEFPKEAEREEAEQKAGRLFSFTVPDVTALGIKGPRGIMTLEQSVGHPDVPWRIVSPVETPANGFTAGSFATQLEQLTGRLVEEHPSDLKSFGLEPPSYTIQITLHQTDNELLEIGDTNLTGNDIFVRKGVGPIYLVSGDIKQAAGRTLKEWRRKELFLFDQEAVEGIMLRAPDGTVSMEKGAKGWTITSPISESADSTAIEAWLGNLLSLEGDVFIDDRKEEAIKGLGAPILTMELKINQMTKGATFYQDKGRADLVAGVTDPKSPIYTISKGVFQKINSPVSLFQKKKETPQ